MTSAALAYVGYGLATLGPGIGIGLMVGKTQEAHGPSARGGRTPVHQHDHRCGHGRGPGPHRLRYAARRQVMLAPGCRGAGREAATAFILPPLVRDLLGGDRPPAHPPGGGPLRPAPALRRAGRARPAHPGGPRPGRQGQAGPGRRREARHPARGRGPSLRPPASATTPRARPRRSSPRPAPTPRRRPPASSRAPSVRSWPRSRPRRSRCAPRWVMLASDAGRAASSVSTSPTRL